MAQNPTFESHPIEQYFRDLGEIIFRPRGFFCRMPITGGLSAPLAFALITHWLGAAASFFWHMLIGGAVARYLDHIFKMASDVADIDSPGRSLQLMEAKERVTNWIWGAGSVIADPFLTLASILVTSAFVFAGARLLIRPGKNGAPAEISYESALRVVCFGMSPAILSAVPLLGGFISWFWVVVVTVIGAREVYRTSTGRAIVVALFPKLLILGMIVLGVLFFAVALIKLFASAF